ncbi:MAG: 4-hydroxy-tetrahydrodipicolinate synthase [Actinomycetia bacterium]|nr:4-hydroxy-tetrahydrodipicolinate synthase [Actinomycetes bacterium]
MAYKNWNLRGCLLPIITPFKDDYSVDKEGLRKLVNYYIEDEKVAAIVPCGTTGESPTLSHEEHTDVIRIVIEETRKRVPVIAGTGSNSTKEAIDLTKQAEDLGADGTLQVGPYYNRPSQEGFIRHFNEIAKATTLPIIIYNIPFRTGRNIEPETIIKLSEIDNIIGLKDASADIRQTTKILKETRGKDFFVYSGEDDLTFLMLCMGAKGAIAATGHLLCKEITQMCNLAFENKLDEALDIHFKYINLMKTLFVEPNPAPIKAALSWLGLRSGPCRLPLVDLSEKGKEILKRAMEEAGKL